MASHYVCTGGCLTVKYAPGKCLIRGCPRHRNPLTECKCRNNKHGDLLHKNDPNYIAPPKKTRAKKPTNP
jgi:hypothetical protein